MTTLMIQGTTSDAGKSAVVTGICRWLRRQGIRVAPFKPQNMALNSAVTIDGGEIGRSQAVQAAAAGLAPHSDMNPVLLKPQSDQGAQVILQGHALSSMQARDYHAYKRRAMAAVMDSYARLQARYDVIVVEGAGSPAEINLRENDIANMGFAEAVDCPVLLVGDINRGGVFAQFVGTLALLSETEAARTRGFIINQFRGDISLLQGGVDWLQAHTGRPVVGVLPYLHGLHLEAEDALNATQAGDAESQRLRVVVPVLPRISNHTDFDPLRQHPQVDFRYVSINDVAPPADLVILPGSKSVVDDLSHLRENGWEDYLQRHLRYGGRLLGICGGFQMLGGTIRDPGHIESTRDCVEGLGLMAIDTVLEPEKRLANVEGVFAPDRSPVRGYEIHAGRTTGPALGRPAFYIDEHAEGALSDDGQLMGTYLHGLFEAPETCRALLRWAGLQKVEHLDYAALREQGIERLADAIENRLDVDQLRELLPELKTVTGRCA